MTQDTAPAKPRKATTTYVILREAWRLGSAVRRLIRQRKLA